MSFYGGSRLPFASLQNSPKLPKPFPAAPRRHSGRGRPFLQLQQALRPWQCLFMEVQGCRLPAFQSRQNSPNPSSTLGNCAPCLLADFTVLDVKLLFAHISMVGSPCLHVSVHKSFAKWALVNQTFPSDNAVPYQEFVPRDTPIINVPSLHIAVHKSIAKWALVNSKFT